MMREFEKEKEIVIPKRVQVCETEVIKIKNGFEIKVKSLPIWEFFRSLKGTGANVEVADWNLALFHTPDSKLPDIGDAKFNVPGGALLNDVWLNASFFRATTLHEGITIKETLNYLPSNPYGLTLGEQIQRVAQELYIQYISPFEMKLTLTSREVSTL